ncbi:MAG: SDR family NAD(P)-dependent oxidoreductase [Anaerolineae bacterium]|nr:SDR family NAD(P)-dependent oxidoreductase [Anaerolineae bacterium]
MSETILVTGGAGFIGSHLVDALLAQGHHVRVFDNLEPQVHGPLREQGRWPNYCNPAAEYILGDLRDREALQRAMTGINAIFHEAAMVGVGQSMYQIERYVDVNTHGTAILLDILANASSIRDQLRKLVVASSMSIYGEGSYKCPTHGPSYPRLRSDMQLAQHNWELYCPTCGQHLAAHPTNEDKPLHPTSVYAISKKDQEELCLTIGRTYDIPTVALRYFNVYGTRQALSNPYTGVAAIFCSRLLNNKPPVIFEDGHQSRDFVHVSDIVQANLLAMEEDAANFSVFNVGSGRSLTIREVATTLAQHLGSNAAPEIVKKFRAGDIRHCFADISRIETLGFQPKVQLEDGISELTGWVRSQSIVDRFDNARQEMASRGLAI